MRLANLWIFFCNPSAVPAPVEEPPPPPAIAVPRRRVGRIQLAPPVVLSGLWWAAPADLVGALEIRPRVRLRGAVAAARSGLVGELRQSLVTLEDEELLLLDW